MTARRWWQNDAQLTAAVVKSLPRLPRDRMDALRSEERVPPQPGACAVFFASPVLVDLFGPLVGTGRYVAYIGVAERNLRQRVGRYAQTLRGTVVDPSDLHLALLPCASGAAAAFVESALIAAYRPVCNGLGWGSMKPGSRRNGQRCSMADALLGRHWTTTPMPVDVALARIRVLSCLTRLDPAGPRWEPLFEPAKMWV